MRWKMRKNDSEGRSAYPCKINGRLKKKKKIKSKRINMQMSFLATVQKYTVDLAEV